MADWQITIDDLVLGAGTAYELTTGPDGFGLPDVRISDQPRPQDHGLYWGADYLGGRTLILEVVLLADTAAEASALMTALTARWQPPEGVEATKQLLVEVPGWEARLLFGRPRRLAYDTKLLRSGVVRATAEFAAADPRIYAALESLGATGLPITSGGRTYPRTYPLAFGAAGTAGTILAVNDGNYPARPVAVITGPVEDPRLENVTTGETLAFDYTLGADATLVVDFDRRTVLEGGTSSRYYTITAGSSWWELVPGLNEVRLRAAVYDPDARLDLRWRSSWL